MIETPSSVPSSIENNSTTPKFYFNPITNNEVKNTWKCFRQDIVTMDEGDDGLLEDVVADIAEVTNIEAATARLATELGEDDDGIINPPPILVGRKQMKSSLLGSKRMRTVL